MKHFLILAAFLSLGACASVQPYGPATKPDAQGFTTQQIENNRFRVSYTAPKAEIARDYALLRASEVTLETGADWFEVTGGFSEGSGGGGGIRPTVGVGGTIGSGGYRSGGVGIGIGLPSGGSSRVTESLEIITGTGRKPDRPNAYDARSVRDSILARTAS
jgi:hypothetical protein